jgi:hypothetical protein
VLANFFRRPSGVGSSLNVYMFTPGHLWRSAKLLCREPRYFVDRLGVLAYQLLHPADPWLTREAIATIDRYLTRDMRGFEWGSGRSTAWLARRLGFLVSVEDDARWYEEVRARLQGLNVDYRYVPRTTGNYARQIDAFPDGSFDFVLVDGSARDACVAAAAGKVKVGGMIAIDNADLDIDVSPLADFECTRTSNGVWRTDLFRRRTRAGDGERA